MAGAARRNEIRFQEAKWIAWHIAALPGQKKFPSLRSFVGLAPRQQSAEESEQIARQWVEALNKAQKQ